MPVPQKEVEHLYTPVDVKSKRIFYKEQDGKGCSNRIRFTDRQAMP